MNRFMYLYVLNMYIKCICIEKKLLIQRKFESAIIFLSRNSLTNLNYQVEFFLSLVIKLAPFLTNPRFKNNMLK